MKDTKNLVGDLDFLLDKVKPVKRTRMILKDGGIGKEGAYLSKLTKANQPIKRTKNVVVTARNRDRIDRERNRNSSQNSLGCLSIVSGQNCEEKAP